MMIGCQTYNPAQMALPVSNGALQQVPLSWPYGDQFSSTNEAALALAAMQSLAASQLPATTAQVPCEALNDFADSLSDLSDLDSSATPSMSSVYELSATLSPASSADSILSAEYERTSPLSHYPLVSANDFTVPQHSAQQIASTCSAVEAAVQQDMKPLLRKPIDTAKLDSRQLHRLMRRRERNKIAASKCRRKTKERAATIRDQLENTIADNEELRREVEQLRAEKAKLERLLASHNCVLPRCGEDTESVVTPPTTPFADVETETAPASS